MRKELQLLYYIINYVFFNDPNKKVIVAMSNDLNTSLVLTI